MKFFVWIGLIIVALAITACSTTQTQTKPKTEPPATTQSQTQSGVVVALTAQSEQPAETTSEIAAPRPETEAGETNNQTPAGETASHPEDVAACRQALSTDASVHFVANAWTAERLARYVGPEIVDSDSRLATNFCKHSVDYSEIISGGPPPDGISPLDNPPFDSIAAGNAWLSDVQPVIALEVEGEAKAYPLAILTRHEIANDEIAGKPVTVTFCPLCNAGLVFNRQVNGQVLRFGVSGNLRNSDLVMWDNKTLSWWQQFTGQAIVGDMTGTQLEFIPAQLVSWQDFKNAYPHGTVLSNQGRNYGQNPYVGYDSSPRPFLYQDEPDPRLPALQRVLGYQGDDVTKAYPLNILGDEKVVEDSLEGREVVIFYQPGQVSALDNAVIERSKEVGSAAIFVPQVDGQKLTFRYENGEILDNETNSTWNIFGQAVAGKLAGTRLEPVFSRVDFWFAWAAFNPNTQLYGG